MTSNEEILLEIRFYGSLAESIASQIDVDVPPGSSVGAVRERLRRQWPSAAAQLDRSRAVIGDQTAGEDRTVGISEQLEFLPPVSGG